MGLLFCQTLSAAVNFTATPSTVSNTYSGNIMLQITGLTSGETVVVQKFLDANTNGVIDGADLLWEQFQLTDGQASVIGGITNINVPGDTDPTPGQITARVIFRNSEPVLNVIGKYGYKLSSPTGLFTPITNSFTITNAAYAQGLTGNVVNHGTNVPHAIVVLFVHEPGDDGPGSTFAGTVADNAGSYAFRVPAGTYAAVASKSNYLGYLLPLPVMVGSGATVSTNLLLTNATRTLSGRLVDDANQSIGLPGLFAHADAGGLVALVTSDTNGNFTFPVGPGHWEVGALGVEALGYINVSSDIVSFDTTTGSVSGVIIPYPKANALFYGSVKDEQGQPLVGVEVDSENDIYFYYHNSVTDDNGSYVAGALSGEPWDVDVDSDPPYFTNHVFPQGSPGTNLSAGQAVLYNFTALLATNHITGHLQDGGGIPISNVELYAFTFIGGKQYYTETHTDGSGDYSLNIANGGWNVGVNCGNDDWSPAYCCPNGQNVNISNANAVVNFTAPGQILITTLSPLDDGYVGDDYSFQFEAATCTTNLNWSATNLPPGLDLSPSGYLSGTPDTAGSNYFFVEMDDGFGRSTAKAFELLIYPQTTDVWEYYVNKLRSYRQTNAVNVVLDSSQGPYNAYLGIVQESPGLVTNATCTLPTSVLKVFPPGSSALELQVHDAFASESAFDAAYPAGNYAFAIHTSNNGVQSPVLSLSVPEYPNAPRISNYAAAQAINPASGFLLQWDAFSGAATDDHIRLIITDTNEVPVFSITYLGTIFDYWLRSTATAVTIPANTLQAGRTYLGSLQFIRITDVNTLGYLGAYGETLVSAQTLFNLATASIAPTLSQPSRPSATQFRFLLTGIAGQNYTIQAAINLSTTNWISLYVTNSPVNPFMVLVPTATNSQRFYRVLVGP